MGTVTVTPRQVAAARLQMALDTEAGRESDPWIRTLATAQPTPVVPSAAPAGVVVSDVADALLSDAMAQREQLIHEGAETSARLVKEAADHKNAILGELNAEREKVSAHIDQLRAFETDYRSKLRSYIEEHINQLEGQNDPDRIAADVIDIFRNAQTGLDDVDAEDPHRAL